MYNRNKRSQKDVRLNRTIIKLSFEPMKPVLHSSKSKARKPRESGNTTRKLKTAIGIINYRYMKTSKHYRSVSSRKIKVYMCSEYASLCAAPQPPSNARNPGIRSPFRQPSSSSTVNTILLS